MSHFSSISSSNVRPLPWTLVGAAFCLIIYALVLLTQPEVMELMGISVSGRQRARMLARVIGVFIAAWGLFQGARWAWWAAVVFAVPGSLTGILGVQFPGRFGHVHYLVDTVVAPIGIAAIMTATVLLLLPQTRAILRRAPT